MLPQFHSWQRDGEILNLTLERAGNGPCIDVQGTKETKELLKVKIEKLLHAKREETQNAKREYSDKVSCEWSYASCFSTDNEQILRIRLMAITIHGDELLIDIVSEQIGLLGFQQTN